VPPQIKFHARAVTWCCCDLFSLSQSVQRQRENINNTFGRASGPLVWRIAHTDAYSNVTYSTAFYGHFSKSCFVRARRAASNRSITALHSFPHSYTAWESAASLRAAFRKVFVFDTWKHVSHCERY